MNENLQKLIKQATHNVLGVQQLDSVILAELIVRECAEIALTEEHEPDECILQHFGITK